MIPIERGNPARSLIFQAILMSHETDPQRLSLIELAQRCAQETDRFHKRQSYDAVYCFELFQRAFANNNQAWDAIFTQYQPQVAGWVRHHSGFDLSGEEIEYFVLGAFEKFWDAMLPDKFRRFPDLGRLLRYLQLCVHSVITDYNRARDPADSYDPTEELHLDDDSERREFESDILGRISGQKCRDWINERLSEKERLVLRLYVDDDLRPREIYAQFPNKFQDVDEVYRIRQNVVTRLGRDPEFFQACGDDD